MLLPLGPHHTITYPVGIGAVPQGMALRTLAPGEAQPYVADFTALLGSMKRSIASAAVLVDPALGGGAVGHDATRVAFEVVAPAGSAGDRVVQLRVACVAAGQTVPDAEVIWNLVQRVVGPDPAIHDDAVTLGGQVVTAAFQPVELTQLLPLAGGAASGDRALVLRDGVLGTLPPGSSGGGGVTVAILAAIPLSGHRAIMVGPAGTGLYADPSAPAAYNLAGISTGAADAGTPVTLAQPGDVMVEPSWSWTPGRAVFVGPAGVLTQTVPAAGMSHQVGQALSGTVLLVSPNSPIRLS